MAMRREQVAAALRYLQDKADLRGRLQRATSLDPQEQDLADIAVETGASLVPGVGPALAARDFERARRADDPVGMGMAAASAVPGGKLAGLLKRYDPTRLELDVYHGTPHRFPATEANPLGEFDASKIGTGKGRNLKGKGIYLTENPERAKEYAESFVQPGFVYKSDLPDEMIEMMLEYDVPIKNQPEKVKKALKTVGIDPESFELAGTMVSGLREGKNLIAEETLAKAGIPGMKVKNIRAKEKKYDFVVFPGEEKKVRILERDGQKAPPQKIAQALEAAPRKPEMAFDAPEVKPGDIVDGLKVRPEVANVGSIKASLDNYTVLPGIRSVSIADFGEAGPLTGNVDKLDRRTRNLADQITESKEITPLIVVYSGSQNYILEGSHRIDALDALGKKRIPVIAVIDEDDPPKFMRQKR